MTKRYGIIGYFGGKFNFMQLFARTSILRKAWLKILFIAFFGGKFEFMQICYGKFNFTQIFGDNFDVRLFSIFRTAGHPHTMLRPCWPQSNRCSMNRTRTVRRTRWPLNSTKKTVGSTRSECTRLLSSLGWHLTKRTRRRNRKIPQLQQPRLVLSQSRWKRIKWVGVVHPVQQQQLLKNYNFVMLK